jgi:hypothetical protein
MNVTTKQSLNGNGVTGGTVTIQGSNFAPGATIQVSYSGIPNRPGSVAGSGPTPTVQGDGTFGYQETWLCTSSDPADANVSVLVTAKESSDSCFAAQNIRASQVFVCTGGNPANSGRDGSPLRVAELHVRGCNAPR